MGAVLDTPVERFNRCADAQSWHWTCDPTLNLQSLVLARAHLVWRDIAANDRIPTRNKLTMSTVKDFVGSMMILERLEGQAVHYRVRLMGTRLSSVMGELQNRTFDEELPSDDAERWYAALNTTLAHEAPLRFIFQFSTPTLEYLQAESVMAPLFDDGGKLTQILVVIAFQACASHRITLDEFIAEHTRNR